MKKEIEKAVAAHQAQDPFVGVHPHGLTAPPPAYRAGNDQGSPEINTSGREPKEAQRQNNVV